MKNLIKKYYEMDDEVKDDLELLYTYQVLLSILGEYEDIKINTIGDLEKLMHIIQKCMITTDFSVDFIITNILEVLDLQDISIKDLYDLEIDDLLEVLFTDNEDDEDDDNDEDCQNEERPNDEDNKQEVIAEFTYEGYYCIFCQNRDKYLLIITKGEYSGVIVLDSISEIFIGWIEIEGTNINYPILKDSENLYYLKHSYNKKYNSNGSIFTLENNPFEIEETLIYGHNMRNKAMFSQLSNYSDKDFLYSHKNIKIYTQNQNYIGEIFSCYSIGIANENSNIHLLDFIERVEYYKNSSKYKIEYTEKINKIIKLSTCSYINARTHPTNQRYYIIANLIPTE